MNSEDLFLNVIMNHLPKCVLLHFAKGNVVTGDVLQKFVSDTFTLNNVEYPQTEGQFDVDAFYIDECKKVMMFFISIPRPINDIAWTPYSVFITNMEISRYYEVSSNAYDNEHGLLEFTGKNGNNLLLNKGMVQLEKIEIIRAVYKDFMSQLVDQ